jgi:hypothetical protein
VAFLTGGLVVFTDLGVLCHPPPLGKQLLGPGKKKKTGMLYAPVWNRAGGNFMSGMNKKKRYFMPLRPLVQ